MNLKTTILLLYFISFISRSQEKLDYTNYHEFINKGELHFLKDNNIDSCFYYYDKAFNNFDFLFVKDALNVAQIAYYSKKDYRKYIEKAFEFGLKPEHLKLIKLLEPDLKKILNDKFLKQKYLENRKKYLEKIDIEYLNTLYDLGIQDQIDKQTTNRNEYKKKRKRTLLKVENLIREKGFPGEKLLGIQDSTIFKDSNSKFKDFYQRISKNKSLKYLTSDDQILSQDMIYAILIHNFCSYNTLKDIWIKEIKKGNIHPRDVALLHDNMYRSYECSKPIIPYKINLFVNYDKYSKLNDKINTQRKKIFINDLEIDELKKEYEQKYGFKFFWGFWDCR